MLTQTRQGKFPIHFVFMKASEGGDYGDKAFSIPILIRRKHMGLSVGLSFYNPKTDPVRQADFLSIPSSWIQVTFLLCSILRRGKDENQSVVTLNCGLTKIEQHYKVKPILYTSYKFKRVI